jgi:hypothetical protein
MKMETLQERSLKAVLDVVSISSILKSGDKNSGIRKQFLEFLKNNKSLANDFIESEGVYNVYLCSSTIYSTTRTPEFSNLLASFHTYENAKEWVLNEGHRDMKLTYFHFHGACLMIVHQINAKDSTYLTTRNIVFEDHPIFVFTQKGYEYTLSNFQYALDRITKEVNFDLIHYLKDGKMIIGKGDVK